MEKKKWMGEEHVLQALNFCMLLPGPEAQQLATYIGWLMHRTMGGIMAGVLFVLSSVFILWGLSYLYASDETGAEKVIVSSQATVTLLFCAAEAVVSRACGELIIEDACLRGAVAGRFLRGLC